MNSSYTILIQITKMFVMMGVGFYLYKKEITNNAVIGGLSDLLLYVAVPASILSSFMQTYSAEKAPNLFFSFIASFFIYTLCCVVAQLIYRKNHEIDKFGIVFSNAGFIGIPLVSGVFGNEAVFYLAPFIGMFYVFVWTYGIWIMTNDIRSISLKQIITNPCILALVLGIVLFLLQIQLPSPVSGAVSSFAGLNTPLAMIVLGAHVAKGNLKDIFTNKKAYIVSALRLIVMPLVIVALFSFIPGKWNEVKQILLIAASAPIGALSPVFAAMYKRDAIYGAQTVCLSTLLSIFTMPLIMLIANLLW